MPSISSRGRRSRALKRAAGPYRSDARADSGLHHVPAGHGPKVHVHQIH